jgi:hypothetical protein
MKQKVTLNGKKKLRKEINGKFNNTGSADEKKIYHCSNFFLCQKLKSRVSLIQLKPILDIFLHGFSLSSCPKHSLKDLLLLNSMCLFKHVLNCEYNFSFFMF